MEDWLVPKPLVGLWEVEVEYGFFVYLVFWVALVATLLAILVFLECLMAGEFNYSNFSDFLNHPILYQLLC